MIRLLLALVLFCQGCTMKVLVIENYNAAPVYEEYEEEDYIDEREA